MTFSTAIQQVDSTIEAVTITNTTIDILGDAFELFNDALPDDEAPPGGRTFTRVIENNRRLGAIKQVPRYVAQVRYVFFYPLISELNLLVEAMAEDFQDVAIALLTEANWNKGTSGIEALGAGGGDVSLEAFYTFDDEAEVATMELPFPLYYV